MVPLSNRTRIGNKTVSITAMQAVLDTGSSVITASTQDANTINSVSALHALYSCLHAFKPRHKSCKFLCAQTSRPATPTKTLCHHGRLVEVCCSGTGAA